MRDLVLVVAEENRHWILDAIAQEIARRFPGDAEVHYGTEPPAARCYFYTHYSLFLRASTSSGRSIVFFTHPSHPWWKSPAVIRGLRRADGVVSMSSTFRNYLIRRGLSHRRVHVVLPGADPSTFQGHVRGGGAVGFCSAYYPRKDPDRIEEIVRALPHRQFVLLGRGWDKAPNFGRLRSLHNFRYEDHDYARYPDFYASLDVFVSPSRLEGGPIPLIEAMMANVVPVATRTGFAPDVVRHGENGFLCGTRADASTFAKLIELAYRLEGDVRSTVAEFTWESFASTVCAIVRQMSA